MVTSHWNESIYNKYAYIIGQCLDQQNKQVIVKCDCDQLGNPILNDWVEKVDPSAMYSSQSIEANDAVDIISDLRDHKKPIPKWLIQFYYECE